MNSCVTYNIFQVSDFSLQSVVRQLKTPYSEHFGFYGEGAEADETLVFLHKKLQDDLSNGDTLNVCLLSELFTVHMGVPQVPHFHLLWLTCI